MACQRQLFSKVLVPPFIVNRYRFATFQHLQLRYGITYSSAYTYRWKKRKKKAHREILAVQYCSYVNKRCIVTHTIQTHYSYFFSSLQQVSCKQRQNLIVGTDCRWWNVAALVHRYNIVFLRADEKAIDNAPRKTQTNIQFITTSCILRVRNQPKKMISTICRHDFRLLSRRQIFSRIPGT